MSKPRPGEQAELLKVTVDGPASALKALGQLAGGERTAPAPAPPVERSASLTLPDGQVLRYTVRAGTLRLRPEHADRDAEIFHVAYTREGAADPATRPLTFCFNGGPGSSSVWLHLGAFGPQRVALDDFGNPTGVPGALVDNDCTLLEASDLVFVDPVSTGFSRAVPTSGDGAFHGVDADLEACGLFVRRYLEQHDRWASPKYLAGESYGSLRVAGLAGRLQERHGVYLSGLVLVSAVLDLRTILFGQTNDLPYQLYLPAYCAVAHHHERLPRELQAQPLRDVLQLAEKFADGPLAMALFQGARLDPQKRGQLIGEYARLSGLEPRVVERCDLRVDVPTFVEELLAHEQRVVGRLDGRYVGDERWASAARYLRDPSYTAIHGAYTATLNDYLRRELGYASPATYAIFTDRIERWDAGEAFAGQYVQTATDLRDALLRNPHLRVHVAAGYTDLATPYTGIRYTVDHLGPPATLANRVTASFHAAGHMMYAHRASHRELRDALDVFYGQS